MNKLYPSLLIGLSVCSSVLSMEKEPAPIITPLPELSMQYTVARKNLDPKTIDQIENTIGYRFKDKALLIRALTTRDVDPVNNYERLEFFGDKILDAILIEVLLKEYPTAQEGNFTDARTALVRQEAMAALCLRLGLQEYIQDIQPVIPVSSLCDIIESVIAAIYEDGGAKAAQNFVLKFFIPMFKGKDCPAEVHTLINKAARELKQDIDYTWVGRNLCGLSIKNGTGRYTRPVCSKAKDSAERLATYMADREFIINALPEKYQYSLIRLATDCDYQPLNKLPALGVSWEEGMKPNFRVRLHTLMQGLGLATPKAGLEENAAKDTYMQTQKMIILSNEFASVPNMVNELDENNAVQSLSTFCNTHALPLPVFKEEKNNKNGTFARISAPWLKFSIKGRAKSTGELAKENAAKRLIMLTKLFSTQHIEPKELCIIDRFAKHTEPTGFLIELCKHFDLGNPKIESFYCEGPCSEPLYFKTQVNIKDKKVIAGQKGSSKS